MKINKINVTGLFGFIDYEIDFSLNDINFISGPNGYGKTMLLNTINSIVTSDFVGLAKIKFSHVILETDVGSIEVCKDKEFTVKTKPSNGFKEESFKVAFDNKDFKLAFLSERSKNILFIKAAGTNNTTESIDKVENQAKTLASKITDAYDYYNSYKGFFDSKIISDFFEKNNSDMDDSREFLKERFVGLFELKNKFSKKGLMYSSDFISFENKKIKYEVNEEAKNYIREAFDIVSAYEGLLNKMVLFEDMVNSRMLAFKTMRISSDTGFHFINHIGDVISPCNLSSGEINQISMLFDLIFNIDENYLVLIDEPEISLHVAWQREFYNSFSKISQLNGFSKIIVATHSPDIINGNWGESVDLYKISKING